MNTDNGALAFETYFDNDRLNRTVLEAENRIKGFGSTAEIEGKKVEGAFSGANKMLAIMGGTAALGIIGRGILETTAKFEKFGIVLRNTLGEVQGNNALDMIAKFAATTPFQLDEVTDSFIRMANQGFVPTQSQMVKLGDLASSTGKSFGQLSEALLDAQTGQFERLKEFGIKASSNGDKVTFSFKEQETTVDKTNSAIQEYILSLGELNGIQGANALISESMTGQISNLSDKFDAMFNQIGQSNSGIIYSGLGLVSDLVENYETVGKVILGLVAVYGAYKTAVMVANAVSVIQREIAYQQMLANIGNTGSTITLTTAEGVAAVAKSKLTAAQLALNASILANPYVAAVAAIVALSAAVYYFTTRTTEAQKAQKELTASIQSETLTLDILFSRLKNATKGTDEYRLAKQAIIDKYGQYDSMLDSELETINGMRTAYDKLSASVIESAKARLRDKYTTEAANDAGENIAKQYGKIRDRLTDVLGDQAGSALFDSVKSAFEAGGDWKKVFKDAGVDPVAMYGGFGDTLGFKFTLITREKEKLAKSLKEFDQIFGETVKKADEGGGKIEEAVVKNKEFWETQRDGAKKVLESMPDTDKDNAKWDEQVALIKEAEKALEAYNLKGDAKIAKKEDDDAAKLLKEFAEAKLDAQKKANDEEIALRRSQITDKKELIDYDLKQEIAAIDEMEKVYKAKASAAGIKSPDVAVFGQLRSTANAQASFDKSAIDKAQYDELLKQYQNFEEKKQAISKDYDAKRKAAAGDEALIAKLNEAQAKALSSLATDELTGSALWSNLFGNLDELAARDIDALIAQIEAKFDDLAVEFDPVDLAAIQTKLQQAKQILIRDNPFKQVGVAIKEVFNNGAGEAKKSASDIKRDWTNLGKATEGAFGFVTDAIDSADFLKDAIGEVGVTAISSLQAVAITAIGVAAAIKTAEKASVILTIIQAALVVVQAIVGVVNAISGNNDKKLEASIQRHADNVKRLTENYEDLERAIDRALGEAKYADQQKLVENLKRQREEYQAMIEAERDKKKTDSGKIDEYKDQIRGLDIQMEDLILNLRDEIIGGTASSIASELGDAMFEAFSAGESAAEAWGQKVNEIVGDVVRKMLIQKLIEEPVGDIINKYAGKWVAYDDTKMVAIKAEMDALTESAKSQFSWAQRPFTAKIAELQKKYDAELAKQTSAGFTGVDSVLDGADQMGSELAALGDGISATIQGLPDDLKKYIFGDESGGQNKAISGAIQNVTEETAGVLSGQINAMRIIQIESQDLLKQQLLNLAEIASNTRYLKSIDARLGTMASGDSLRSQGF